jgi:hypothetical protein
MACIASGNPDLQARLVEIVRHGIGRLRRPISGVRL